RGAARRSAHPGLSSGVRVVEDAGRLDAAFGVGGRAAHGGGGVRANPERRRRAASARARGPALAHDPAALRDRAGPCSEGLALTARSEHATPAHPTRRSARLTTSKRGSRAPGETRPKHSLTCILFSG